MMIQKKPDHVELLLMRYIQVVRFHILYREERNVKREIDGKRIHLNDLYENKYDARDES